MNQAVYTAIRESRLVPEFRMEGKRMLAECRLQSDDGTAELVQLEFWHDERGWICHDPLEDA